MNNIDRFSQIRTFRMKLLRGWKKARCTLCELFIRRFQDCQVSVRQHLRSSSYCVPSDVKKICRLKLKSSPVKPLRQVISKLGQKPTNELERLKRKGNNWTANDLFKFQHGNFDYCDAEEKRAICMEWIRRVNNIPKKYCYLAWYASAIYSCYYRLAPLLIDKEEKRRIWMDVKREYAEIFLMGRRIWRRPTHPTRLRILYDLAMLCVCFNDVPNDETVVLFRDLLDDHDNFNFEVLNEIEYAQSIDKAVRLENHVIDLFYQRRKSTCSTRSSLHSRGSTETPRSSFRSLKMKSDDIKNGKLRKVSSLSTPADMILDPNAGAELGVSSALKSPQLTRKLSVRFADKADMNDCWTHKKNMIAGRSEMEKRIPELIPVDSLAEMRDTNSKISERISTEFDGNLLIPRNDLLLSQLDQTVSVEPVIVNITTSTVAEFDKEVIMYRSSESVETTRTFPLTGNDGLRTFANFFIQNNLLDFVNDTRKEQHRS